MKELKNIKDVLEELEQLLYGFNYECHFQFKIVSEDVDISKARNEINSTFSLENWQMIQKLIPISYSDFEKDVKEKLCYRGDETGGHGLNFTEDQEKKFQNKLNELWTLLDEEIGFKSSEILIHPEIYTWIFWGFCFLILSKNKIYLFEGVSSD